MAAEPGASCPVCGATGVREPFGRYRDEEYFTSAELFPDLQEMMRNASGAAGFGYEITLMRRYMTLAGEGAGWVVVYSPDEAQVVKVTEIAKRFGARSAVHYGRLLHEDLI